MPGKHLKQQENTLIKDRFVIADFVIMNRKYLALYLIAGTVSLILVIYLAITTYPNLNTGRIILDMILAVVFYYLAYKTYHEKKDSELM